MKNPTNSGGDRPGPDDFDPTVRDEVERTDAQIGPYRLLERLGSGAMGEVWRAEQRDPVRRIVALKLIKRGMDTREVITRFEIERQAMALMDHPGIARVYDAGETRGGRPYIAMEYVPGEPIHDYCRRHRLTIEQRLRLFQKVCQAVQHAHQKAVIHRDLKPSNILVVETDGEPTPKVIDFGIAKATAQQLTDRSAATLLGQIIGTPLYMSPEQVESSAAGVDTRADVYSLGVVLYELLVGALPHDAEKLANAAIDQVLLVLREEQPVRPSTRISTLGKQTEEIATQRRLDARKLSGVLRGDLDWITLKALEKNRIRRYESPRDLAEDIDRYLSLQPIEARPPSLGYRTSRFVRRHRVGVGVSALAVLVLVAFALTMAIQARRIAAQRDRAEANVLVARGRLQLETDPTAAAAHALASIETREQSEGRQLLREALWRAPLRRDLPKLDGQNPVVATVARDGSSYAVGWVRNGLVELHPTGGGESRIHRVEEGQMLTSVAYTADDRHLVFSASRDSTFYDAWLEVLRVTDGERLGRWRMPGWCVIWALDDPDRVVLSVVNLSEPQTKATWHELSVESGRLRDLGTSRGDLTDWYTQQAAVDPRGRWIADGLGREIILQDLGDLEGGGTRVVGSHDAAVRWLSFDSLGRWLASTDVEGQVFIWDVESEPPRRLREYRLEEPFSPGVRFDRWAPRFAAVQSGRAHVWNLDMPAEVQPVGIIDPAARTRDANFLQNGAFLICRDNWGVGLWERPSTGLRDLQVAEGKLCLGGDAVVGVDGAGKMRVVPLTRELLSESTAIDSTAVEKGMGWWRPDVNGRYLTSGSNLQTEMMITDLQTLQQRRLTPADSTWVGGYEVRISPSGRRIAGWWVDGHAVADLSRGETIPLRRDRSDDPRLLNDGMGGCFEFVDEDSILELALDCAVLWDLRSGSHRTLWAGDLKDGYIIDAGESFLAVGADGELRWIDPWSKREVSLGSNPFQNILGADRHEGLGLIAVSGLRPIVALYSLEDGRRWTLPTHESAASYAVGFDPAGRWLSVANMQTTRVWALPIEIPEDRAPLADLQAYVRNRTDAIIVPDASASTGYRIQYRRN